MRSILAVGLAVVAALLVWEVGLRLSWHNPYRREAPDYILKIPIQHPNTDQLVDRSLIEPGSPPAHFRTDARSYVLPSIRYEKPDATIAFLGGSTTASVAVRQDDRFPALVGTLLAQHGFHVNVLNAGRAGGTVQDSLNVLLDHMVEDRPDIILMMHGGTDGRLLAGAGSYRPRMGGVVDLTEMARWSLQMLSSRLDVAARLRHYLGHTSKRATRGFAAEASKTTPQVPLEGFEARLRIFVAMARAFGATPVLMTEPRARGRAGHVAFDDAVRKVAREENALLIDLTSHIESLPDWNEPGVVFYDGVHANDAGSKIFAEYIQQKLLPLLEARKNR